MRFLHVSLAACLAIAGAAPLSADVLQMPEQRTAPTPDGSQQPPVEMELPVRGMTMGQVEARFGTPSQKISPVGTPPIARWIYPDYTVYFEHKYVIHTVLTQSAESPE